MQQSRELSVADAQFTKSALTYYIESAKHAIPAANLPEFVACIQAIARHRDIPSGDTHEGMIEQYELLRWNERLYTRPFSAVKEFYFGLRRILEDAVDGVENVSMSSTFAFTEAVYHAARALGVSADNDQRLENEYQNALWERLFHEQNS
jgi:hypothetical protein